MSQPTKFKVGECVYFEANGERFGGTVIAVGAAICVRIDTCEVLVNQAELRHVYKPRT